MSLMINDISVSKELGGKEMAAVYGGSNINKGNYNEAIGGLLGSPAVVVAPVTQVDPFGFSHNINKYNTNFALGGGIGSPAAVVAPVSQN
jgi:hypothetical protein